MKKKALFIKSFENSWMKQLPLVERKTIKFNFKKLNNQATIHENPF